MRRLIPLLALTLAPFAAAADADPLVAPAHRVTADDPAWQDLAGGLRKQSSLLAHFTENRWFQFRKTPTVLKGEVRVSSTRGLSLHYQDPQEQILIVDEKGMLVRTAAGDTTPPADSRGSAANSALLHVLSFDLRPLTEAFEIYGLRSGATWQLALLPKDASLRRTLGQISIDGEGNAVRRIELRRAATQRVEILIAPPHATSAFSPEDIRRFFR